MVFVANMFSMDCMFLTCTDAHCSSVQQRILPAASANGCASLKVLASSELRRSGYASSSSYPVTSYILTMCPVRYN